ncbi:MAG TPA: lamin tail domain-containing protein, partial [Phycisphaerae bacterium]|nr:lamin tail domain-containing protein [Phycisphaerae bacterium]
HDFDYADGWFPHTDGEGFSLVVRDAAQDIDLWDSKDGWRASWALHGNPGQADPSALNPGDVVLSELLAHTDGADGDWVELGNTTASAINITGWFLSDDPGNLLKYRIGAVAPVSISGGGFVVFTQAANFGDTAADPGRLVPFAFSEFGDVVGDALFLTSSPDGIHPGGYREDEYYGPSLGEVSFGRYEKPSGGKDFVPLASPTFNAPNAAPVIHDVVINEIMYNPDTGGLEFIELYNRTTADVPLHDDQPTPNPWKFTDGVTYTFPTGAYVPAGGYALVIGVDQTTFESVYGPVPAGVNVYGPWDGALADEGERIELCFPGAPEWTDPPPGEPVPYIPYVLAEKITYDDRPPWPTTPDGNGPSLERLDPDAYGNDVANWGTSPLATGTFGWANGAAPPSVTVSIAAIDADAREQGRDPGTFRISRTGSTADPLIVYYGASGSAVGADYEPALPGWIEIPAGSASATIVVTPFDDTDPEQDETLVLTLVGNAAYGIGDAYAAVTIEDNDGSTPDVAVHMVATDPSAAEQDTDAGTFTIYRVGSTPGPLTVHYTVGGTAGPADYQETLTGTVVILPTENDVSFDVTPVDDPDLEDDETIQLTITPDPSSYLVGTSSAAVTIADNDNLPPVVTGVALNPHPNRTARGLGQIDPGGLGVGTVLVTFSKDVTFLVTDVIAEKVTFDALGNETGAVAVTPESVAYGGTNAEMVITFANSWQTMVDTWVRITLAETITDGGGQALDGEPRTNSSGLGYIYGADLDLPSGDGVAGGAAVFYVGSLRGDMRGYGPGEIEPDGEITPWDITGFTQKYLSDNLDADMAGYGPGQAEPDADVNPWDISGFTSRYSAAMAAGTHLELLPTGGEGLAVGTPAPLPLAAGTAETATPLSVAPWHGYGSCRGRRLACPAVQADETVSMLAAAPEIGLLTRTSAEPAGGTAAPPGRPWAPGVQHGRPSGCRATHGWASQPCHTRGHALQRPIGNMATRHQVAMPPAETAAPWSPATPDTGSTDSALTADGGLVDLLAAPALDVLTVS